MADASDSKSDDGNIMWVQVPSPAHKRTGADIPILWTGGFNEIYKIK